MDVSRGLFFFLLLLCGGLALGRCYGENDAAQATSYDAGWSAVWVPHCVAVAGAPTRTPGLVLEVGDSITRHNENSTWPLLGQGKTAADAATIAWCHGDQYPTADGDLTCLNGFYLATFGYATRGFTAAGGIDTVGLLTGTGLAGLAMPAATTAATAQPILEDTNDYPANLNLTTMIAGLGNAQFAVLEIGTNDINSQRDASTYASNVEQIVQALLDAGIMPVLCTCPPRPDDGNTLILAYNQQLYQIAQQQGLPLIDFYQEILARRPGTSWQGTLIIADDVHPTASGNGYDCTSSPYVDGGDPTTGRTGAACQWVGYLLRSWLIVQKLTQLEGVLSAAQAGSGGTSTGTATAGGSGTATGGTLTGTGSGGTGSTTGTSTGSTGTGSTTGTSTGSTGTGSTTGTSTGSSDAASSGGSGSGTAASSGTTDTGSDSTGATPPGPGSPSSGSGSLGCGLGGVTAIVGTFAFLLWQRRRSLGG